MKAIVIVISNKNKLYILIMTFHYIDVLVDL